MRIRIHAAAVCATTAVLVTAGVRADPTVSNAPPVFCMRITDIERCPDDISGASFIIDFGAPVNTVSLWQDLHECNPVQQGSPCPWDTSGDGQVGIVDFLDLLGHWGDCP